MGGKYIHMTYIQIPEHRPYGDLQKSSPCFRKPYKPNVRIQFPSIFQKRERERDRYIYIYVYERYMYTYTYISLCLYMYIYTHVHTPTYPSQSFKRTPSVPIKLTLNPIISHLLYKPRFRV